jgi:hypothetical protein
MPARGQVPHIPQKSWKVLLAKRCAYLLHTPRGGQKTAEFPVSASGRSSDRISSIDGSTEYLGEKCWSSSGAGEIVTPVYPASGRRPTDSPDLWTNQSGLDYLQVAQGRSLGGRRPRLVQETRASIKAIHHDPSLPRLPPATVRDGPSRKTNFLSEAYMSESTELNWPRKGDKAFTLNQASIRDPALVNAFVLPAAGSYAYGYKEAADKVVESAKHDIQNPDPLFFPVAFLYRHYLELTLKELVCLGRSINAIEPSFDSRSRRCPQCDHKWSVKEDVLFQHNLDKLWKQVRKLIKDESANDGREVTEAIDAIEKIVQEFHILDGSGQETRYARNKKGEWSLTAPGGHQLRHQRVSLENLRLTMEKVERFLEASYCMLDECQGIPEGRS